MNNPSSSIVNKFCDLIILKVKNSLDKLFINNQFVIYEKRTILSINNGYVYEDPNTYLLFLEDDIIKKDEEYLVYTIHSIVSKIEFSELFNLKNKPHGLNILFDFNDEVVDFIYNPDISLDGELPKKLFKEYIEVYCLFSHIRIHNHNNYFPNRLSFSIPGRIYNRPDREYYIVMNNNYNFNIQVYKLNFENRREEFILGIWMNISDCGKKIISAEPFFLKNKFMNLIH